MTNASNIFVQLNRIGENMSGVFALFLIISGNFLGDMFPVKIRATLRKSVAIKHVVAFFTLYFFVVLIDASQVHAPLTEQIGRIAALYTAFLVLNCSEERFVLLSLLIMALLYFIRARRKPIESTAEASDAAAAITTLTNGDSAAAVSAKREARQEVQQEKRDEQEKRVKQQETLQELDSLHVTLGMSIESMLVIVLLLSLVLGFFIYAGYTQSYEPHSWRWSQFIFGLDNGANIQSHSLIPIRKLPGYFMQGVALIWRA